MTVSTGSRPAQLYRRVLRPALKSFRRWVRDQAAALAARRATAAGLTEAAALASLRALAPRQRWEGAMAMGRHPQRSTEAIAALIAALADPDPFVRWKAATALANQDVTCVFHALTDVLTEGQPLQRAGAAEALGRIGGEAATNALCKQVNDPEPGVRRALASALGQIGDPTTAVELAPLLEDADVAVQCAAARALGQIASPGTAAPLAAALARPGQPLLLRRALAAALTRAHHPDAQPALLAALADPDPQVRGYAARALGHIGNEVAHDRLAGLLADRHALLKGTVGDEAQAARTMLEHRGRRAAPAASDGAGRPPGSNPT
jgi:HEAT repeat protein